MTVKGTRGLEPAPSVRSLVKKWRLLAQPATDIASWAIGLSVAMLLRFDFHVDTTQWGRFGWGSLLVGIALAAVLQLVIGWASGLYKRRFRYGSFDEVLHLAVAVALTTLGLVVLDALSSPRILPISVAIIGGSFSFALMGAARYLWRLDRDRRKRPSGESAERVLVFGAGEGGTQVIDAMLRNPHSTYLPVALVDDDPAKRNLRLKGVPVMGTRRDVGIVARKLDVRTIIIAIPSADAELMRDVSELALAADLGVLVLPPLEELFGGPIAVADIRRITETDLLGRHVIDTDLEAIAEYLAGKRVLVTGAGGSIGSELCHQIHRFGPDQLVMVDRDESALHALQLGLEGRAMLDSRNLVVCDIRDAPRVQQVFDEHRPEVVFHAAALKHLPLLEMYPSEALKSNVFGTQHVLDAAQAVGVERFVNVSTDKAADPISVLGYTKRIAEMLTATVATQAEGTYLSVRFGNVLGSRGSVLTGMRAQIEAGGPITVTHPDVTRYFMTVQEAVQLVVQAGAIGRDGEALVFDMGEPVRIDDVARRLAKEAPRPIDIVYTCLRPGEKLEEVLLGTGEADVRPVHPLISHVSVPLADCATIRAETADLTGLGLTEMLASLAALGAGKVSESRLRNPV